MCSMKTITSLTRQGMSICNAGDHITGIGLLHEALYRAKKKGSQAVEIAARNNLAIAYQMHGNFPTADVHFRLALEMANRITNPHCGLARMVSRNHERLLSLMLSGKAA